jgi:dihydrofolate reductase
MKFSIVVAVDLELGIGKNNNLPWRLPGDMKFFKTLTSTAAEGKRNAVIMGRKTWESLPSKSKPLPNRLNIVVSTQSDYQLPEDVLLADSLEKALELAEAESAVDQTFVIGGAQIYETAIDDPNVDKIYLTEVYGSFDCDKFFPEYEDDFKVVSKSDAQFENELEYTFIILEPNWIS